MLFDETEVNKKDLYDTEMQLKSLIAALKRGAPLVVILGLRRTGKTFLLMTVLNQHSQPFIIMDLRSLANKQYATRKDLIQENERALNDFYNTHMSLGKKLFN